MPAQSLQDILKSRQTSEFVGREHYREQFRRNLQLDATDERKRFVYNIFGQGGVGKTTLVQQLIFDANTEGAITAYVDEEAENEVRAMDIVARKFSQQGCSLKNFDDRYRVYRQIQHELETDPKIPKEGLAIIGQTLTKVGLQVGKSTPIGPLISLVDEKAAATQVSEWMSYVVKKLTNKDDLQLVLEPVGVLTPLWVQDLNKIASDHEVTLFFDAYERTGQSLDGWLRELIEGRYGDLTSNIVFTIAGQKDLELWTNFSSLIARFPLDVFTESEAREYLTRKGVINEQIVESILRVSGCLPLLVAMLAAQSPADPKEVADQSSSAIEWFLKGIDDSSRRNAAVNAALPRFIDRDLLGLVIEEGNEDELFDWLQKMPFVEKRSGRWSYHSIVRVLMLQYKREYSKQNWIALHSRLGEYYEKLRENLGLGKEEQWRNTTWLNYSIEAFYHRLCQMLDKPLALALNEFLSALNMQRISGLRWAEAIQAVGKDTGMIEIENWGRKLILGLKADEHERYDEAVDVFTTLLNSGVEVKWRPVILDWRGYIYSLSLQFEQALVDLNETIQLAPKETDYWVDRGMVNCALERYEEALIDFTQAIELQPKSLRAITSRGVTYQTTKNYDGALADFERALSLEPQYAWAVAERGETYRLLGRFDNALADFNHAIDLYPNYLWAITCRGVTYQALGRYDDALVDLNHVVGLKPDYVWAIAERAETLYLMGNYDDAINGFTQTLELDSEYSWAITRRGEIYNQKGNHQKALEDLTLAIELNPQNAWAIAIKGTVLQKQKRYDEALGAFSRALELNSNLDWVLIERGETNRLLRNYQEALVDLNESISANPANAWIYARRGYIHQLMKNYSAAISDFKTAIDFETGNPYYHDRLGDVYLVLGELEKARDCFEDRINIHSHGAINAHVGLGLIYMSKQDVSNASREFNQALATWQAAWHQQSESPITLLENKAVALFCLEKREEAIQMVQEISTRKGLDDPLEMDRLELLTVAGQKHGYFDEIIGFLKQALS